MYLVKHPVFITNLVYSHNAHVNCNSTLNWHNSVKGNTVKTRVGAPFCLSFGPKIVGAAYTQDHCFQRE